MFPFDSFERDGFAISAPLLGPTEIAQMILLVEQNPVPDTKRGGVRDIMDVVPKLRAVAEHPEVRAIVDRVLGTEAFPVRATLFDKTGAANWKVPWHQDVTVAVSQRRDTMSYGPWSVKAGVHHVQPPSNVLHRMVTIRVHLDDCPGK